MRGVIVGALILASGTWMTGCCHDRAARQEAPPTEQPAAPAGTEGNEAGNGGSGSTAGGGEGSDIEARSVEISDDENVTQEDLGGSDAATERGMVDERNAEPQGIGGSGEDDGSDVQPLGNDEFQGH